MSEPDPVRPPQVTYAGLAIILGSVAVIVYAFEVISSLHTLDTRTWLEHTLSGWRRDVGLTVVDLQRIIKAVGMVAGGCAAAAVVLGWQTMQRSRSARIALLVLAFPLVLSGLVIASLYAVVIAVAVIFLWLPTANAWFDPQPGGKMLAMSDAPPPPPSGQQPPPYGQQPPPPTQPIGQPPSPYQQPTYGQAGQYGQAPAYGAPPQAPYPPQQPYAPPYSAGPIDPDARPGQVTAAAIIAIVLSGLTALFGLILAVVGASAADSFMREMDKQGRDTSGFTTHDLAVGLAVVGGIVAVVGIVGVVVAILVLRRSRAARVVLTVLASLTILFSAIGILSVITIVPLGGAIATIVLLFQRRANDWFGRRGPTPYPPVQPGGTWPAG